MELVLAADPMCSWCYGFAKQMELRMHRRRDVSLTIILGGLRAGATETRASSSDCTIGEGGGGQRGAVQP